MLDLYPSFKPRYLIIICVTIIVGIGGYVIGQTIGYHTASTDLKSKYKVDAQYVALIDTKTSGTSFDNAIPLKLGYETDGTLKTGRNIDTYYFQLDTTANVRTSLTNLPHEYNTFIYDGNKKLIASSLRSGYLDSSATIGGLHAGKYYIQIVTNYGEPVDYPYTIRVDIIPVD